MQITMFSSSVLLQNTELYAVWKALAHLIFKTVKLSSSHYEKKADVYMHTLLPSKSCLWVVKAFCAAGFFFEKVV